MTPAAMIAAGVAALRQAEAGRLTHEAAARTAIAWAALAQASERVGEAEGS